MIKITKDWLKTKLAITQIYDKLISQPLFQNDNVWADEQQQLLQQQQLLLLLHSIFTDWMLFLTPNQQC